MPTSDRPSCDRCTFHQAQSGRCGAYGMPAELARLRPLLCGPAGTDYCRRPHWRPRWGRPSPTAWIRRALAAHPPRAASWWREWGWLLLIGLMYAACAYARLSGLLGPYGKVIL